MARAPAQPENGNDAFWYGANMYESKSDASIASVVGALSFVEGVF